MTMIFVSGDGRKKENAEKERKRKRSLVGDCVVAASKATFEFPS
jgi:hypothetical protein